ncbi:MAG TPA: RNA polymerase sigma factor [Pseudomonadales bacterium]|jgi:RNA polymerase sigma-70 factor (ECF subfamily)
MTVFPDETPAAVHARHDSLNRFLGSVERRALRMAELAVHSRDDALDIVQETMIALASRYADRPEAEWTPLFYRILQTRIASWHRQHNRRRRYLPLLGDLFSRADEGDATDYWASDSGSPEQQLAAEQSGARIEAALRALPLRQQQVFLLRHWEQLDVKATAKIMGCSEGSVKTHLHRAMARLREALGEGVL